MIGTAVKQIVHGGIRKHDWQHAVLETVVVENVGEAGRNDNTEPIVREGPRGVLTTGAGAEVAAGKQDAGPAIFRPVQFEVRVLRAVIAEPPIEKQELSEACPLDALEELLGDDLIGIDIGP